jgi:hypothetical protein
MSREIPIFPFMGLYTAMGEDTPPGYASSMLNVRVGDGKARPRYGYRNLQAAPSGYVAGYGFERLSGYDDSEVNQEEWVSIEDRSGTAKPYSVNKTTGARTVILNGVTPLSLQKSPWRGFVFQGDSYWVNPDSTPSIFRHEIGDATSWSQIGTLSAPGACAIAYASPYSSLVFTAGSVARTGVASADAFIYSGTGVSIQHTASTEGLASFEIDLNGSTAGIQDWSKRDHFSFKLLTPSSVAFEIDFDSVVVTISNNDGTPVLFTPPTQVIKPSDETNARYYTCFYDAKTRADWDNIRKIKVAYTVTASTGTAADNLLKLSSFEVGYIDFNFGTSPEADTTFALAYYDSTTGLESALTTAVVPKNYLSSTRMEPEALPRLSWKLTFTIPNGASSDKVRVYVKIDDTYYLVDEVADTVGTYQLAKNRVEVETANTEHSGGAFAVQTGIINGAAFKGWAVWLYEGGYRNIRHSKVGSPIVITEDGSDVDESDNTRPATFSLADDFADEPVGAVGAGDALMILGKEGVYTQAGDYPSQMTPPRKIPGSNGCANKFAYGRFKSDAGEYGVSWLDQAGNIWFAGSSLAFASDAGAKPVELSAPIRGYVRQFLIDDSDIANTDFTDARMAVDEATQSLWVTLGNRALVLRPPTLGGTRQWEAYEFALTSDGGGGGTDTVTTEYDDADGAVTSVARTDDTDAWTTTSNALTSDDAYAICAPISPGDITELLHVAGLDTLNGVPSDATLTGATVKVEHKVSGGDTATKAYFDFAKLTISGVAAGDNEADNTVLTDEDTENEVVFDLTGLGITPANVNDGIIGIQLGYTAMPDEPFEAGDWTISYDYDGAVVTDSSGSTPWAQTVQGGTRSGNSSHAGGPATAIVLSSGTVTVIATYIGPGDAPTYVPLAIHSKANYTNSGTSTAGSADNGFGDATVAGVAEGTHTVLADVVGGVAEYPVIVEAHSTGQAATEFDGCAAFASIDVDATIGTPADATINVDSVQVKYTYTIPTAGSGVSVDYLAFSPLRKLWALRSSGHIDEIEWNSALGAYIEGTGRDGGYAMPEGHWKTGTFRGRNLRLSHVGVDREDQADTVDVTAVCDRATTEATVTAQARYVRFGVGQQGWNHSLQFAVTEAQNGIVRAVMVFTDLSRGFLR